MKYTPEQARQVLTENTGILPWRDFYEALRDGELPTYFCQKFAHYRLHSDDLPGPRLAAEWHPDYPQMKCRESVIGGIVGVFRRCIEQDVIKDHDLTEFLEQFSNRQWNASRGSKGEYWTTREEIDLINSTLDRTIHSIEITYGIKTDWENARQRLNEERKIRRKAYLA